MPKYLFSEKQKDDIVNDYINGMPLVNMYEKYSIKGCKPIYRILKERNVDVNRNPYHIHYNNEMLDDFNRVFADSLNGNYIVIDSSTDFQKYIFDINYFNKIDTQDKAYILGLLYADGNIDGGIRTMSISLQERDVNILNKIRDILGIEKELKFIALNEKNKNWQNQYCLSISNKHLAHTLVLHGVVPNKSLILKFPTNIPMDLYRHFLRGYIDGDGCISNSKRDMRVRFASTLDFCNVAKLLIETQLKINVSIKDCKSNNITKELLIAGGYQTKKFLDWIYEDANLYLKRKYDRYQFLFYDNTISL